MLQIILKNNGYPIHFIDIVDESTHQEAATYEVTFQGKKFGFKHNWSEGALVCARKALQAIEDESPSQLELDEIDAACQFGKLSDLEA